MQRRHPVIGDVRGGHGLFAVLELVRNRDTREPLRPWPERASIAPCARGPRARGGRVLRGARQPHPPGASARDRGARPRRGAGRSRSPARHIGVVMTFKLTYSTMFNPPEEMHERFESALAEVRAGLGAFHAMHIDGQDVRAAQARPICGPIDQRVRLGEFATGDAADVDRAVAAARRAFDTWRRTPVAERLALVRRVAELIEERVYTIGAALALEVGKNRMEVAGRGAGNGGLLLRLRGRVRAQRRLRPVDARRSAGRLGVAQSQRAQAPRRVGGHRAVQLPDGAGRGADGRRARDRQHRRPEGRERHAVGRTPPGRLHSGRRHPARRLQLRDRERSGRRRRADPPSGRGRRNVHRLVRRRHGPPPLVRDRPLAAALHHGTRRQEPVHRLGARRSRARLDGNRALGIRNVGAEVLGVVPRVRRAVGRGRTPRADRRAGPGTHGWRSHDVAGTTWAR